MQGRAAPGQHSASTLVVRRQRAFTLVELVMVIALAGILAAVALPRVSNRSDSDLAGFREGVRAVLRLAQKTAIAQHRNVSVNLVSASGKVSVCYDSAYPCVSAVADPAGSGALVVTTPAGISFATTAAQLTFDWTGSPNGTAATLTVSGGTGAASAALTVDGNTGYVQ